MRTNEKERSGRERQLRREHIADVRRDIGKAGHEVVEVGKNTTSRGNKESRRR